MAGVAIDEDVLARFLQDGGEIESGSVSADPPSPASPIDQADGSVPERTPPPIMPTLQPPVAVEIASAYANRATDWVSAQPTPGGIGLLVLVLIVLVWAMIPVNDAGATRLQLLWLTLTGRTRLRGRVDIPDLRSGISDAPVSYDGGMPAVTGVPQVGAGAGVDPVASMDFSGGRGFGGY